MTPTPGFKVGFASSKGVNMNIFLKGPKLQKRKSGSPWHQLHVLEPVIFLARVLVLRLGRAAAIRFLLWVLSLDKQVPEISALTSSLSVRT
jgi:hypothetical protein